MSENPGYLKLRKIRAAQHIAQTVRLLIFNIARLGAVYYYCCYYFLDI